MTFNPNRKEIERYIRSIRNEKKRAYARAYAEQQFPAPKRNGLSLMAAQAVERNINAWLWQSDKSEIAELARAAVLDAGATEVTPGTFVKTADDGRTYYGSAFDFCNGAAKEL